MIVEIFAIIMNRMKKICFLLAFWVTLNGYAQHTNPIAKIPFTLEGNHIFIQLSINHSRQLDFVFDTGAGGTVINAETAVELNYASSKTTSVTGASGKTQTSIIKNKLVQFESIRLNKTDLLSVPLNHLERSMGKDIDGIIGYDILKKYVTKIDYDNSELTFYAPKSYQHQGEGQLVKIDIGDVPTAIFQIALKDGTYLNEEFLLDTGSGGAVSFTSPFSKKHQLSDTIEKTYSYNSKGLTTNVEKIEVGRIKKLKVLDFEFENVPASIHNTEVGFLASKKVAGLVGNEILKRFNITYDYKRKRSYWVKNNQFVRAPFYVQNSGLKLALDATKSKVIIDLIIPESSAAKSDLKIGDEIIEIDGVKTVDVSLEKIRKLLITQSGKTIKIVYLRAGEEKELLITLEPLI